MAVRRGLIDGLLIIERPTVEDGRGFFRESFRMNELEEARGQPTGFVQENHSRSRRGTLRGLHAENWEKLVYVPHGEVFTVIADVRASSPTFGCVETFVLGDTNRLKLFLPRAVAHGFCVLSEEADVSYLLSSLYDPATEAGIAWDDPEVGVEWPVSEPLLSERDRGAPRLAEIAAELPW